MATKRQVEVFLLLRKVTSAKIEHQSYYVPFPTSFHYLRSELQYGSGAFSYVLSFRSKVGKADMAHGSSILAEARGP